MKITQLKLSSKQTEEGHFLFVRERGQQKTLHINNTKVSNLIRPNHKFLWIIIGTARRCHKNYYFCRRIGTTRPHYCMPLGATNDTPITTLDLARIAFKRRRYYKLDLTPASWYGPFGSLSGATSHA